MATKAVAWAMRQAGISGSAKLLLVELSSCLNRKHLFCWPSQRRLELILGVGARQVRRLTRELEAAGLVRALPGASAGHGRGRKTNRYFLAVNPETGEPRSLADVLKLAKLTGGHLEPPASGVTGGQIRPLQADTNSRFSKEEPGNELARGRASDEISPAHAANDEAAAGEDLPIDFELAPIREALTQEGLGRAALWLDQLRVTGRGDNGGWFTLEARSKMALEVFDHGRVERLALERLLGAHCTITLMAVCAPAQIAPNSKRTG